MADDPYASFSSPVQTGGGDPYASFSSPAQQEAPPVTAIDRAGAVASGFNRGVAGVAGIPVDTAANVQDLAKAIAGSLYGLFGKSESKPMLNKQGKPAYYDVGENGELIPGATAPVADIPDSLQIVDRSKVFGSGQYIADRMDDASRALTGQTVTQIPRPDDKASRYLYAAGQGLPAAFLGPGRQVTDAPSRVSPETMAALSGATGGTAAQFAAEHGAPPELQAAAGFAGAMAPSVARVGIAETARQLARGGEEGRRRVEENIQVFKDAGDTPSIGQATESRVARATESLLTKTPGAAGRMAQRGEAQSANMGARIEQLADDLAPQASGEQAGRQIQRGISGEGGFIQKFKDQSTKNYDALDAYVKKDAPFVLPKTTAALDDLTKPIAGAEKTSKFFVNSTIRSIKEAMDADLKNGQNTIPYEAVKKIRSIVGENLADSPFGGDVPRSQWKKLYSALSDDIEVNAKSAGPKAQDALSRANRYHAAGMKRLEVLGSVVDKAGGPEAVFRAATSGAKEGATTIRSVMQSLPEDAQKTLSATVLRRLGRSMSGKQNDLGEKFSTETFLTNWNSLSPQAKSALFNRYGKQFRFDMDQIAKAASNLRDGSAVFRNPSGTGQAMVQASGVVTALTAFVTGHPAGGAAVVGGAGLANLAARVMTNPKAVAWLAKATRAPQSALPALINQAAASDDEDLKELAESLKQGPKGKQQ